MRQSAYAAATARPAASQIHTRRRALGGREEGQQDRDARCDDRRFLRQQRGQQREKPGSAATRRRWFTDREQQVDQAGAGHRQVLQTRNPGDGFDMAGKRHEEHGRDGGGPETHPDAHRHERQQVAVHRVQRQVERMEPHRLLRDAAHERPQEARHRSKEFCLRGAQHRPQPGALDEREVIGEQSDSKRRAVAGEDNGRQGSEEHDSIARCGPPVGRGRRPVAAPPGRGGYPANHGKEEPRGLDVIPARGRRIHAVGDHAHEHVSGRDPEERPHQPAGEEGFSGGEHAPGRDARQTAEITRHTGTLIAGTARQHAAIDRGRGEARRSPRCRSFGERRPVQADDGDVSTWTRCGAARCRRRRRARRVRPPRAGRRATSLPRR